MANRRHLGSERWLGLLVRIFPAAFRDELGDEMKATLRAEHAEAAGDGRRGELLLFWLRNIGGALRTAPREHAEALVADTRHALRRMARRPLFTLTAAMSLAVGIAATATVAAVTSAAFFRPIAGVAEPEQLVDVKPRLEWEETFGLLSYPDFLDLERRAEPFCDLTGFSGTTLSLALDAAGEPERVFGQVVTASYFPVLGLRATAGRFFEPGEDLGDGAHPVTVLSAWLWHERFGADPTTIGRQVWINGRQLTVVGIGPEGFRGPFLGFPMDVFLPASMAGTAGIADRHDRGARWLELIGRRRADVSLEATRAGFALAGRALAEANPEVDRDLEIDVTARHPLEQDLRGGAATFLLALGLIAASILAVACVNVANLSLTHLAARRGEMALRLSLGASRSRVAHLLLTESLALAAFAGGLGLLLATWATKAAGRALSGLIDGDHLGIRLDAPALGVAFAVCLGTILLFGSVPSLRAARTDLAAVLRQGRSLGAPSRLWRGLVVVQVVFSMVVLVCAGLFLRVLGHAESLDPGFRSTGVVAARLDPSQMGMDAGGSRQLLERILARADALPGSTAALTDRVPLSLGARFFANARQVEVPGWQPEPGREGFAIEHSAVSEDYFAALSIPLVDGRLFDSGDRGEARRVAVVNQTFADRFFPDGAVGRTVRDDDGELAIVGVVRDSRYRRLDEPATPYLYLAFAQASKRSATLLVSGGTAAPDLSSTIRAEAPHLPVAAVELLDTLLAKSLLPQRIAAAVAGALGLVGMLLTAFGLYGLVAYTAQRRTAEIGLRMSLGARPIDILWMMLRQGLALTVLGIAVGWPLAAGLAQLAAGFLVGLDPVDPPTYLGISFLLLSAAFLACWLPARRGARIEPSAALRPE